MLEEHTFAGTIYKIRNSELQIVMSREDSDVLEKVVKGRLTTK